MTATMNRRTVRRFLSALALSLGLAAGIAMPAYADTTVTVCTEAGLRTAIAGGRTVRFNCGAANTTITINSEIEIRNNVTIDGAGKITLRGGGGRIFFHRSYGTATSTLTLKNMTITNGRASGVDDAANGGAIRSLNNSIDGKSYPPTLNIEGVTFIGNATTLTAHSQGLSAGDFGGGAIYTLGGYLNIKDSTFTGNAANNGAGGAIHILQSSVTIDNSTFTNNSAIGATPADGAAGAVYVDGMKDDNGQLRITRSAFTGNTTYNSGGAIHVNMYQNNNRLSVDQSSFINNTVVGGTFAQGGAIGGGTTSLGTPNTGNASIIITNSTFAGNSAKKSGTPQDGTGGALGFTQRAVVTIANATFFGNTAYGTSYGANGGAITIINQTTPIQMTNSTIAGNHAGWVGGGTNIGTLPDQSPGGILRNMIIANNTAGGIANFQQQCDSELIDGGNNLQYPGRQTDANYYNDVTCLKGKSAPNQKNLPDFRNPQLGPLANNGGPTQTMAIPASSPAFNGGNNATCPTADQRGVSRPQGASCDIGAFELVLALSVSPQLIGIQNPDFTLTVTGAGFTPQSQIIWRGQALTTTFIDSTTLRATVTHAAIGAVGAAQVSISNSTLPAVTVRVVVSVTRIYLPMIAR